MRNSVGYNSHLIGPMNPVEPSDWLMGDKVSDGDQSEHTCAVLATGQGLQDTAAASSATGPQPLLTLYVLLSEDFTGQHISLLTQRKVPSNS